MEPRSYSAVPIDTNFAIESYRNLNGDVALDPDLPISNLKASINADLLGYVRTFGFLGQTASAAVLLPYFDGRLSGNVGADGRTVTREGLGDAGFRLTYNLIGNPALTPKEFALRDPSTTVGVSFAMVAPTGDYNPRQLINISSHRFAFRSEIGASQPIANWFIEGAAGAWMFTGNPDFYGGHVRGQEPIFAFQTHAGYNFGPNFWISADANYYMAGRTSVDGEAGNNYQSVLRYGVTASAPFGNGFSIKAARGSG